MDSALRANVHRELGALYESETNYVDALEHYSVASDLYKEKGREVPESEAVIVRQNKV